MLTELIAFGGHDAYGAGADWREGNRDDLVLALAGWWGERAGRGSQVVIF